MLDFSLDFPFRSYVDFKDLKVYGYDAESGVFFVYSEFNFWVVYSCTIVRHSLNQPSKIGKEVHRPLVHSATIVADQSDYRRA